MYKKICIVLFITIFCNGVTYSSPIEANVTELNSKEQEVSTQVVSDIDLKARPNFVAPDNGTHHIETLTNKTSANHSEAGGTSIPGNSNGVKKIANHGSDIKNDNQNIATTTVQNPNASSINSTSTNAQPTAHTPPTVPLTNNTPTNLPPRNYSDMSRPIPAGQNTSSAATLPVGTITAAPVTKPTAVTPTPAPAASTSTDKPLLEYDSSSKAQQNRFDGASFVGGIVLTIGLTAIGFIAFKYYKSGKIDANYRTL